MTVEVADALDLVGLAVELDLVTFHDLLDGSADVRHADVNTSFLLYS